MKKITHEIVQKIYQVDVNRQIQWYEHDRLGPYAELLNESGINFMPADLSLEYDSLRSVVLSDDTVFADNVRLHALILGPLFYKPTEDTPPTGAHILPEICANRTMRVTRSITLSFDVQRLAEYAKEVALVPDGQLISESKMGIDIWKAAVKREYFHDLDSKIDDMLDSIYSGNPSPPVSKDVTLLGKVMVRVHKDDVIEYGRSPIYYSNVVTEVQ
jgi:hypothetical protein